MFDCTGLTQFFSHDSHYLEQTSPLLENAGIIPMSHNENSAAFSFLSELINLFLLSINADSIKTGSVWHTHKDLGFKL